MPTPLASSSTLTAAAPAAPEPEKEEEARLTPSEWEGEPVHYRQLRPFERQDFHSWLADKLFGHRVMNHFLTEPGKAHRNPPMANQRLKPTFELVELVDLSSFGLTPITRDAQRSLTAVTSVYRDDKKLSLSFSTTSHVDLNIANSPVRQDLLYHFDDTAKATIHVFVPEIHPSFLPQPWFNYLAHGLLAHPTKLTIKINGHHAAHSPGITHRHVDISALAASAIVMRAYGHVQGFAHIVSLAPAQITADFRTNRMGAAIGTQATKIVLTSIFTKLAENDFVGDEQDAALQGAAADLLVAHMGRDDHREFIARNEGKPAENFRELFSPLTRDYDSIQQYADMAAVRDGIIFGAMHRYNHDLVARNKHHAALFNVVVQAAAAAIKQGLKAIPVAGGNISAAVETAGDAAISLANLRLTDKSHDLSGEIERCFRLGIEIPAYGGSMPGYKKVNKKITLAYAQTARRLMEALALK